MEEPNRDNDIVDLTGEHARSMAEPPVRVAATGARGQKVPIFIDPASKCIESGRRQEAVRDLPALRLERVHGRQRTGRKVLGSVEAPKHWQA